MKMKKRLKIFILILSIILWSIYFFAISYSSEESNSTEKKIEDCVKSSLKRDITDYVCIEWTREEIAYQIVLDEEFTKIDDEIEEYLNNLEKDKDKYFWQKKEASYIDAIDEISEKFTKWWYYYAKYYDICKVNNIILKAQPFIWSGSNIDKSLPFFDSSTCINLAKTKLYFYKNVAYDILMLNKWSVRKDAAKINNQQERTKYDNLIDIMNYNENFMESIFHNWTWKIKKAF